MEQTTINPLSAGRDEMPWKKIGLLLLVAALIMAGGILAYQMLSPSTGSGGLSGGERITAEQLAADHGLSVRLIGVTAAGGMVDFRLKIVDVQKAQKFLEDPANLPRLIVADSGKALMVPEGLDDDIEWTEGGILFNFYPNDNGLVESGTPVIVEFGALQLEPIEAQ